MSRSQNRRSPPFILQEDVSIIELRNECLEVVVQPEVGGSIRSVDFLSKAGPVPLLIRDADVSSASTALASACYAMVPFANRAAGNLLRNGARTFAVERNHQTALAVHGAGWTRGWTVTSARPHECCMTLSVAHSEYPLMFSAEQQISLIGSKLRLSLSICNRDAVPIPVGLGFHPFFPRLPRTTLRFAAGHVWMEGPDHLPVAPAEPAGAWDFSNWRLVPTFRCNNNYSGWSTLAEVDQPDLGVLVRMTASSNASDLMVFALPGTSRFALEPQTHTSGFTTTSPIVSQAQGLEELAPGATYAMSVVIEAFAKAW